MSCIFHRIDWCLSNTKTNHHLNESRVVDPLHDEVGRRVRRRRHQDSRLAPEPEDLEHRLDDRHRLAGSYNFKQVSNIQLN